MEKLFCNCNYEIIDDEVKENINGEGILIDIALAFVTINVSLVVTLIDYAAEYWLGVSATDWIESHVSKTILEHLGGKAHVSVYQPSANDSPYPPHSYQAILWAQQHRQMKYSK